MLATTATELCTTPPPKIAWCSQPDGTKGREEARGESVWLKEGFVVIEEV